MGALTGGLRYPQPNSLFGSSEGAKTKTGRPRPDAAVAAAPTGLPQPRSRRGHDRQSSALDTSVGVDTACLIGHKIALV